MPRTRVRGVGLPAMARTTGGSLQNLGSQVTGGTSLFPNEHGLRAALCSEDTGTVAVHMTLVSRRCWTSRPVTTLRRPSCPDGACPPWDVESTNTAGP